MPAASGAEARSERPAELAVRGTDFRHENPRASPRAGKLSARLQLWIACARGSCGANRGESRAEQRRQSDRSDWEDSSVAGGGARKQQTRFLAGCGPKPLVLT